jgi:hypothetical protein
VAHTNPVADPIAANHRRQLRIFRLDGRVPIRLVVIDGPPMVVSLVDGSVNK